MVNTTDRVWSLDYARIITAFMVVLGHIIPDGQFRCFIYGFHMPLFFVVSGLLHKERNTLKETINNSIRTLLIPLFFFCFLMLVYYLLTGDYGLVSLIKITLAGIYRSKSFSINPPLWFLLVLLYLKVIFSLVHKFKKYCLFFIFWASLFAITLFVDHFYLGATVMAIPFYAVGFFKKEEIIRFTRKMSLKWVLLIPVLGILVHLLTKWDGLMVINYGDYGDLFFPLNVVCFFSCGAIGSFMILVFSSIIKRGGSLIVLIANSLITILGIQWFFIEIWKKLFPTSYSISFFFVGSLIISIFCVLSHLLIVRYVPFVLGKSIVKSKKEQ